MDFQYRNSSHKIPVVVGSKSTLDFVISVANRGTEPSLDAGFSFESDIELPIPLGYDCVRKDSDSDYGDTEAEEDASFKMTCAIEAIRKSDSRQEMFKFPLENLKLDSAKDFYVEVRGFSHCNGQEKIQGLGKIT